MLDINNILMYFGQLSGCREEDMGEVTALVMSATKDIEAQLDADRVTEEDIPACEYAAACSALYDYVCREACRDSIVVTAGGNADTNADLSHRVKCAASIKKQALGRIAGLTACGGFVFGTM